MSRFFFFCFLFLYFFKYWKEKTVYCFLRSMIHRRPFCFIAIQRPPSFTKLYERTKILRFFILLLSPILLYSYNDSFGILLRLLRILWILYAFLMICRILVDSKLFSLLSFGQILNCVWFLQADGIRLLVEQRLKEYQPLAKICDP